MTANSPAAWSERATRENSWDAALWSEQGQRDRFASVLEALNPQPGETLLDYGCGTGAFTDWIPDGVNYLGYDWSPGMLIRAELDHPKHRFTDTEPVASFDLVACVGPFNLPDGWSKQQTRDTLARLWQRTQRTLVVCLYAGADNDCLIYTEAEALDFGAVRGNASVRRHLPNDLLLTVRR